MSAPLRDTCFRLPYYETQALNNIAKQIRACNKVEIAFLTFVNMKTRQTIVKAICIVWFLLAYIFVANLTKSTKAYLILSSHFLPIKQKLFICFHSTIEHDFMGETFNGCNTTICQTSTNTANFHWQPSSKQIKRYFLNRC